MDWSELLFSISYFDVASLLYAFCYASAVCREWIVLFHPEGRTERLSVSILFMKLAAVYLCSKQIIKLGQITGFEWALAAMPMGNIEPAVPKVQLC